MSNFEAEVRFLSDDLLDKLYEATVSAVTDAMESITEVFVLPRPTLSNLAYIEHEHMLRKMAAPKRQSNAVQPMVGCGQIMAAASRQTQAPPATRSKAKPISEAPKVCVQPPGVSFEDPQETQQPPPDTQHLDESEYLDEPESLSEPRSPGYVPGEENALWAHIDEGVDIGKPAVKSEQSPHKEKKERKRIALTIKKE